MGVVGRRNIQVGHPVAHAVPVDGDALDQIPTMR
jgi:hypothetical protein